MYLAKAAENLQCKSLCHLSGLLYLEAILLRGSVPSIIVKIATEVSLELNIITININIWCLQGCENQRPQSIQTNQFSAQHEIYSSLHT